MQKKMQNSNLYRHLVPVNSQVHLSWKLKDIVNYSFAKNCNAALITRSEFEKVSKIYPLVFVMEEDRIVPVALFGLHHRQNLFLKWNHQWDANYIPAYIRRYPFSLASLNHEQENDYIVCIDEQSPLISKQGEFSLFESNGKQSFYLKEKINFLKDFQLEYDKTIKFSKNIQELGLFEPMSANVNLVNGEAFSITGFYTINKDRFKSLDQDTHHKLIISDEMKLVYEHFSSLDNFANLIDKTADKKIMYGHKRKTDLNCKNKKIKKTITQSKTKKEGASKSQVL